MGHGCSGVIPPTVEVLVTQFPFGDFVDVLDLGCGHGGWGGRVCEFRPHWSTWGVEADARHQTPLWECYREVVVADLRQWVPQCVSIGRTFDLGLAFEVLEHLSREDGEALLPLLPQVAPRWLLSTPDRFFQVVGEADQEAHPFDVHRSVWAEADFTSRGWQVLRPPQAEDWNALGWPMWFCAWPATWDLSAVKCVRTER